METSVKQRLISFMKYKGLGQSRFEKASGLSNGYINSLRHSPSVSKLQSILGAFPELNKNWLLTGEGEMLNDDNNNIKYACAGVPYYNVDFTLGFDLVFNDQTTQPDYYVDFPPYNRCDAWINARGDSMSPTISSGDMVALQKIEDFRYLISGEIYAVVTKNGLRTIKRVNDMGESLKLIPDNKEYEEQIISKEELLAVFYVKGNVKAY